MRAQQVADRISEIGLPGMGDPYHQLQDVFMHSKQEEVATVVRGINTDKPDAVNHLVDLIAGCNRRAAHELLEAFTNVRDDELAEHARGAGDLAESLSELDPSQQAPREQVEKVTESAKILSDAEIKEKKTETATTGFFGIDADTEAPEDALDYREYARALAATICDSTTETPFTLGVCAPWGRGKTALLHYLEEEIEKINDRVKRSWTPFELDHRRAKVIRFNAWRYSRAEQVWSGFISTILRELEDDLYGIWTRVRLALKLNKSMELPVAFNLIAFIILILVGGVVVVSLAKSDKLDWLWGTSALGIGSVAFYAKFLRGAWKFASSPFSERIMQLSKLPDFASRLDPVHKMLDDIRLITDEYRKGFLTSTVDRFVVMIDDIDRCDPNKIMETLEAIKHLVHLERFVFVIAMDSRVVRHAIGEHYKFMSEDHQEWEEMGRFYLEKMIQVPFHLPTLSPTQRLKLNEKVITRHLKEIVRTPESTRAGSSTRGPTVIITSENGEVIERRPADEKPTPAGSSRKTDYTQDAGADSDQTTPEPKRDPVLRSRITTPEHKVIKDILEAEEFDVSPRLWKRFINIYLIARHVLILEHRRKTGADDGFIPDRSFIKWLAVSVRFPWGARALIRWLTLNKWTSPFEGNVFAEDGSYRYRQPWTEGKLVGWTDATHEPFEDLWVPDLNAFGAVLSSMDINWNEVKDTLHITNCFNLVLE